MSTEVTTTKTQLLDGAPPDWSEFSVEKWRSAVFKSKTYFSKLYIDTNSFLLKYVDSVHATTKTKPSVIEVGCGTGESLLPVARSGRVGACLGVDVNPKFITYCNEAKEATDQNVLFLAEDATNLSTVLTQVWDKEDAGPKIVTCLGNTVGIMPVPVKDAVLVEMAEVAGDDGIAIVVYWNGNYFGDALQNFYFKNPRKTYFFVFFFFFLYFNCCKVSWR